MDIYNGLQFGGADENNIKTLDIGKSGSKLAWAGWGWFIISLVIIIIIAILLYFILSRQIKKLTYETSFLNEITNNKVQSMSDMIEAAKKALQTSTTSLVKSLGGPGTGAAGSPIAKSPIVTPVASPIV
tara:strand:+ start:2775 stop:3161 length:387 start_codon:yes stop_codon:yes gene_type:complete